VRKGLKPKQQLRAIAGVASLSFKAAPAAVIFKLFGSLLSAIFPIATTFFAAKTTTELAVAFGGDAGAKDRVILYVIITAVLGLCMTVWSSLDNLVQAKMRYVVDMKVSNQMSEHFLSLDFWRYDDKETIDLYDRALKFSQFFSYIFDRIATIISNLISAITAVAALILVNWFLALFVFVALLPGVFVQFRLSRQQVRHWNENVEVRRKLNLLEWMITQPRFISELRLYNLAKHFLAQRTELKDKDELKRIEIERKTLPLTLLSDGIASTAEISSLLWIALQVVAGKQPIGQFLYVQQMVSRALSSTSTLVSTISNIDEDIANLFDYEQFMRLPVRRESDRQITKPVQEIRFNDVSFHYPGKDNDVLKHISMTIRRGDCIAVVGENGAGKSTFVKLLTGLYKPTAGRVTLDGKDVDVIDIQSWHSQLGVLQQEIVAFDFATARDNVRFGDIEGEESDERVTKALREAEAEDFIKKLPKGVDSYVNNWMEDDDGVKGSELSGGQWQRLTLARNFYRSAPIVILDEPTSAIDALAESRIFKRLFTEKDRTIIAVSHRLSTIRKADCIYMFKDGKIVESGSAAELIKQRGHFFSLFESQIDG